MNTLVNFAAGLLSKQPPSNFHKEETNTISMKKSLLLGVLAVLIAGTSFGQEEGKTKRKFNYFAIGLHGGWTQFYGDIRQYDFGFTENSEDIANGGGGIFVDYQLNSVIDFYKIKQKI